MKKCTRVIAASLSIIILNSVAFAQEEATPRIKQSLYSNLQKRIITKCQDIKKAKIRAKLEKVINYAIKKHEKSSLYLKDAKGLIYQSNVQRLNDIIVGDMTYKDALLCHEDNTITYDLKGRFNRFEAYVGVSDNNAHIIKDEDINGVNLKLRYPVGRVQFSVFVDDALVYFSSVMNGDSLPEYVSVDVSNKDKLRLVAKNLDLDNKVKMAWLSPILHRENIIHKSCDVAYERHKGTFLYCNNPESITSYDTLNNGKIIYKETNVCKDINLFCEQNNSTNQDMYYGVILRNNTNDTAKVTVTNQGMSKNWWTGLKWDENCWREYQVDRQHEIRISPNEAAWLVEPSKVSTYNKYTGQGVVNLVSKFNVDTPIDVEVVAYNEGYDASNPSKVEGSYEGYRIEHEHLWGEARNYKGKSKNYPFQECTLEWDIDDNTNIGYLPIRYGNINKAGYITHITQNKHTSALGHDMYEFIDLNNICFSQDNVDYSTMIANLGNWAITYKETIRINNKGKDKRRVNIIQKNAFLNNGVIVIHPNGDIIKTGDESDNIKNIETFEVCGGKTHEVTLTYLIPACSFGGLGHYVNLE